MQGILHIVVTNELVYRKDTYGTEHGHVIAGKTNIFVSINGIFGCQVEMILVISKRREFVYHFVPFQIALSTGTLAPLLGCLHSKVPVREFERWVDGGSCTQCFLCRDGTFQDETTVEFIISCESIHKLGSFLHQFVVLLNHFV